MIKSSKHMKIALISVSVILIALIGIIIFNVVNNKKDNSIQTAEVIEKSETVQNKDIKIFSGTDRAIAVMIDNNKNAWPQASINKAYIVYEIIVEGGETRMMALFKNSDTEFVGPIRSSRHYFLDYALENDAIYVHLGWSPQAQSDISTLGVNNINGQYYDSGKARTTDASFWRDKTRSAPHNAFASIAKIYEIATEKGYKTSSDKKSILNYNTDEVELATGNAANTVTIPYSNYTTVKFTYNADTKRYTKYSKGQKQTDSITGDDITAKNIIITFAENYTLTDVENKGRQGLKNIGTLDGYYITNGKAIPIKCTKTSRDSQTVYKDLDGNEISVNDGNTFIQICPLNAKVVIE